jgi:hypothetical protein
MTDDDSEYQQFLKAARADAMARTMPSASGQRIEATVGAHVSWRRRLPPSMAAGLATRAPDRSRGDRASEPASKGKGLTTRGSWTKALAMVVPVVGFAAASYSITSAPAPAPVPAAVTASLAEPAPAPEAKALELGPAQAESSGSVVPVPTLSGPGDLPDAKYLPAAAPLERVPPASVSRPNRAGDETFEAELALLSQVTTALQEKQPARALSLIDEHDRRFPNGALAPEFAGERVLTLAALGRHAEACAQSKKFVAKYPKSPFVPQVRSTCVDSTSTR